MNQTWLLHIVREGLMLAILLSLPPLLASLAVGLLAALIQAITQVQEQTLSFVPKMIAVFASLLLAGPWIFGQATRFATTVLSAIPVLGR
ncbi:MAG: flagellar type III secretion system protein FliQ [Deltaproteobacteria bacterium]|nr:flagellar type III secretion system protein FliQ [Deltaproteobacteria bacterium]